MIDRNKRVYVYFNLHRKCFSVRQGTRVVEHTNQVCLKDVRYMVQPAGRAKVLKEKKKNVHAGLSGYYVDRVPVPVISFDVTYNPYKYETFVSVDDLDPQEWSEYAYLECGDGWRNIEAIFSREYFQEKVKVSA